MDRRDFVRVLGCATLTACSRPARPTAPQAAPGLRAVAFDLFTIFDPRSIDAAVVTELGDGGAELARLWKLRAFEYCWLRAAADRYAPFDQLVDDALTHALAAHRRSVPADVRARLLAAWTELEPWPDSVAALTSLHAAGFALAPLANFAPSMIERLFARARVQHLFAHVLSTDRARSFKPAARAYQLGVDVFGLPPSAIAFAAFGGWDAVGASWFGYPTFWVNRLAAPMEQLSITPAGTGPDLQTLASWVRERGADQLRLPTATPAARSVSSPIK